MRLVRVHIKNFKLFEDVQLRFSTDPQRPLTVIRAQNGSGKTSFMSALLWAFYGMEGLPADARELRLTSSAAPAGEAVDVSVMIEFEHTDDNEITTRYRLIRTMSETPTTGDAVNRTNEKVRLLRITPAGEEDVQPAEALIGKFVPRDLRNIFFTSGDDVQTFISGVVGKQQRQTQVHIAIRALLGMERLRNAAGDIETAFKHLRAETAKSGGADVEAAEKALAETDRRIEDLTSQDGELVGGLANMADQKAKWNKELNALRGIGDIDELNSRIQSIQPDIEKLETARTRILVRMRDALKSEACSWALIEGQLDRGIALLSDLADRHVIPGISLEVLTDRLELGVCICAELLPQGSPHRAAVEKLLKEQRRTSDTQQRLTALFHEARHSKANHDARRDEDSDFARTRVQLFQDFTDNRDLLRTKGLELEELKHRRAQINEDRVRNLVDQITKVDSKISEANKSLGRITSELDQLNQSRQGQDDRRRDAEKSAKVSGNLVVKRDVADDLMSLAKGTLRVLEGDYVKRVSDRMDTMFMGIVGSNKEFEAGVFKGVHIGDNFDIVIDAHDGRQLDPDFELNGASQRALTLSFIWSLMEVSGTTAPRIIDSPLGMVAGGVKTRMIDAITCPPTGTTPDFQVVLLLTRAEVRDVENLLDDRAGMVQTLSCSKDYPEDLVYCWDVDRPVIWTCDCSHRVSCRVCARRYDEQHGVEFRDEKAGV